MFASLGAESEHRDANKRATGRRHAPREMTAESGEPNYYTSSAAQEQRANDLYRQEQMNKANAGPSFMDNMFSDDGKRGAAKVQHGAGVNRPACAPKDRLNVFAWDTHDTAGGRYGGVPQQQQQQQQSGARAGADAGRSAASPISNAESLRHAEARKFEQNTTGHFLNFSDGKSGAPAHRGKKIAAGGGTPQHPTSSSRAPFATDGTDGAMVAGAPNRSGKKVIAQKAQGDGRTVQGFKGLGDHCNEKPTGRKVGKAEPTQVFLPVEDGDPAWLEHGGPDAGPYPHPAHHQQQQQHQRSVHFENDGVVYDDERYFVDQEEAMYADEQQQRRVMQFQRNGRRSDDSADYDGANHHY